MHDEIDFLGIVSLILSIKVGLKAFDTKCVAIEKEESGPLAI